MSAIRADEQDKLLSPDEASSARGRAVLDAAFSGVAAAPLPERPYHTLEQVAVLLGVTERYVLRMVERGELEAFFRPGTLIVYDDDLEAMLKRAQEATDELPRAVGLSHRYQWAPDERTYGDALLADPCCYCGRPPEAIDHIEPRINGGQHRWENLTAACKRCNSSKGARPLLTFLLARSR